MNYRLLFLLFYYGQRNLEGSIYIVRLHCARRRTELHHGISIKIAYIVGVQWFLSLFLLLFSPSKIQSILLESGISRYISIRLTLAHTRGVWQF